MGNTFHQTPSNANIVYNLSLNDWQIIQKSDLYIVWRNNITQQQMQQYHYTLTDAQQYKKIKDLFEFRFQKQFLVAGKYFKQSNTRQLCSTNYRASMFTQRIHRRLNTLNTIKFPSILHVYHAALRGFNELYQRIGYFPINQQMIGINGQRKIKVWVNSDFGAFNSEFGSRYKTEKDLIKQIIYLIDNYTDHTNQPQQQLSVFLDKDMNFKNTLNLLYDYVQKYKLKIPAHIDLNNDFKQENNLNLISQISQNILKVEKQQSALSKSNHNRSRSNVQNINNEIIKDIDHKYINNSDIKVQAPPIKLQHNNKVKEESTSYNIKLDNMITFDRQPNSTQTFMRQSSCYPSVNAFVNKLINVNKKEVQKIKHSPLCSLPKNIIYLPQNQMIKKQITNIKNLQLFNKNNQYKMDNISNFKNNERASSLISQRLINTQHHLKINNIIPIKRDLIKYNQFDCHSTKTRQQENVMHDKKVLPNQSNGINFPKMINKQQYNSDIPFFRQRNVQSPILLNSLSNQKLQPSRMINRKMISTPFLKAQLKNQNPQIIFNYVNRKDQKYLGSQKNLQNKIQNQKLNQNFQIQITPRTFIKNLPKPTFQIQSNQIVINNASRNNKIIIPIITSQNTQNIKNLYAQKSKNNEQIIKNFLAQEQIKNMDVKQARLTSKHEYIYEFDLPANQDQDQQKQSKHIKIIINSEVKNQNKKIGVRKIN